MEHLELGILRLSEVRVVVAVLRVVLACRLPAAPIAGSTAVPLALKHLEQPRTGLELLLSGTALCQLPIGSTGSLIRRASVGSLLRAEAVHLEGVHLLAAGRMHLVLVEHLEIELWHGKHILLACLIKHHASTSGRVNVDMRLVIHIGLVSIITFV